MRHRVPADPPLDPGDLVAALTDVASAALALPAAALRLEPIATVLPREDAARVFRVCAGANEPSAVVLCSPPQAPDIVQRGTDGAADARRHLPPAAAWHVLQPLAQGRLRGLSYAVLPYCLPLASGRIAWRLQRARLAPRMFQWLRQVTAATAREATADERETRFVRAAERLASMEGLPADVRADAAHAARRLRERRGQARVVLMHGDLWKDNVMLRPPAGLRERLDGLARFVVIDWPAATPAGHPFYDLVRLAHSLRASPATLRREVERHCALLGCDADDALASLLAACGHFAADLQHFAPDLFTAMVIACHSTLRDALPETRP